MSMGAAVIPRPAGATTFRVGLGRSSDAYEAAIRAVNASGEWPTARLAGRPVVIKTNLVLGGSAESGGTTSPEVVRALVDLALAAGAARVTIVEGGRRGAPFAVCGYDFFRSYDPLGRVTLVDLNFETVTLAAVPGGWTYRWVYMPQSVMDPSVVFISAAKLKTHVETGASLSLKNLFGVPPIPPYYDATQAEFRSRYQLHERGVHEAIADLSLARPIDFAVIDGIWGMEGDSPSDGSPVRMDVVIAGANALAVDRVGAEIMMTPQERVQHFTYAALKGLGPGALTDVTVAGDAVTPHAFVQPSIPPGVWAPRMSPSAFAPGRGERTAIAFRQVDAAQLRLQVFRISDVPPSLTLVRTLRDWAFSPAGVQFATWDGRDDAGALVPPGTYGVRVQTDAPTATLFNTGTGWVRVTA